MRETGYNSVKSSRILHVVTFSLPPALNRICPFVVMRGSSNDIIIRPYTHKELASLYGVSWVTLQKWLKPFEREIGHKIGHFYTTKQVEIIFEKLGWPKGLSAA
jgi:hypothetical protein